MRELAVIEAAGRSGRHAVRIQATPGEAARLIARAKADERCWLPLFTQADVASLSDLAPESYAQRRQAQIARSSIFLPDVFAARLIVEADAAGAEPACNEAGDPREWRMLPLDLRRRFVVDGADGRLRVRIETAEDWRDGNRTAAFEGSIDDLAAWAVANAA